MNQNNNTATAKDYSERICNLCGEDTKKKIIVSIMAYRFFELYDEIYHTHKLEKFMENINQKIKEKF